MKEWQKWEINPEEIFRSKTKNWWSKHAPYLTTQPKEIATQNQV